MACVTGMAEPENSSSILRPLAADLQTSAIFFTVLWVEFAPMF